MSEKKRILILGTTGMLGSVVYKYFKQSNIYDVWGTARKPNGNNIFEFVSCDYRRLNEIIQEINPHYIINCIGTIPQNKPQITEYYLNNFRLPAYIADNHKKAILIQPSTDCVFNGSKLHDREYNLYSNNDFIKPNLAHDAYGISKLIFDSLYSNKSIIIRGSIIGPSLTPNGKGLFDWVLSNKNKKVQGFTDHYWNGNTTLEFAKYSLDTIEKANKNYGVYTIGNSEILTKLELITKISQVFNLNVEVEPLETKKRIDKTLEVSPEVKGFSSQLEELKNWCVNQGIEL